MLEAQRICCERDTNLVIEHLSFSAAAGEIVHLTGSNGAGKTTLIRTLCGLIRPETGDILCHGQSIFADLVAYRKNIQYVGHENGLKLELTPFENLQLHHRLHCGNNQSVSTRMFAAMDVERIAHIPCRYLSAGQKRRVALARLLVSDTPLWLLDEPMTALDRDAQDSFAEVLRKHADDGGCTIMATHHKPGMEGIRFQEISLDEY